MEPELKEILHRLEEKITANYQAVMGRLDGIDRVLEKMQKSFDTDHDDLIRLQGRVEETIRDFQQHRETEAAFGRQFDQRLKDQEAKVWKLYIWAAGVAAAVGGGFSLI